MVFVKIRLNLSTFIKSQFLKNIYLPKISERSWVLTNCCITVILEILKQIILFKNPYCSKTLKCLPLVYYRKLNLHFGEIKVGYYSVS